MRTSVPASCFATRNCENSHLPLLRLVGSSCGFTWLDFCCCGSPGFLLRMPAPECLLKRQRWLQFQLDLWKDLVSTEWLWPFLPDIYQSKRRWELSSYIFRNTVAGFVSIVRSSQQRRVLWTLGSCGCTYCHIGAVVAVVVGWRSCGCTRCAGAVGAAPFAWPLVRSTPKLIKHWAWSGCTLLRLLLFWRWLPQNSIVQVDTPIQCASDSRPWRYQLHVSKK